MPSLVIRTVDHDPQKVGQDIGVVAGGRLHGMTVVPTVGDVGMTGTSTKFALHATASELETVWPQIKELLDRGFSMVSTCEQLAYPWHRHPRLTGEIAQYAFERGLTVAEFQVLALQGQIGHVGVEDSVRLIAAGLGWRLSAVNSTMEPTVTHGAATTPWDHSGSRTGEWTPIRANLACPVK